MKVYRKGEGNANAATRTSWLV